MEIFIKMIIINKKKSQKKIILVIILFWKILQQNLYNLKENKREGFLKIKGKIK